VGKDLRRQLESGSLRRGEPSYYQLLGLPEFEQDERKIYEAARSALEQARKLDRAQSARLVSRLLHARNTLTSPEQKADYDERLRNLRESQPAEIFKSAEHALDSLRRRMESGTKEEGKEEPATPGAVMVYVLLILIGIGFNYLMHRKFQKQAAHLRGFAEALRHFEQGDSGKALKTFRLLAESDVSSELKKASASKVEEIELVQKGEAEVRTACSKMLETLFAHPSSSTVPAFKKVQKLLAGVSDGGRIEALPETVKVMLSVETMPAGAEVLVGSRRLGTTPLITAIEPFEGNLAVFLAEESYERLILPVRLAPSQKLGLRIEMFRLADLIKHPWRDT